MRQHVSIYAKGGVLRKRINNFDLTSMGAKIKSLREERKLSMRELASRAGVAVSFISKIESGKTSPTIMTLQKILEAMRVTVVSFFSEPERPSLAESVIFKRKDMKALESIDRTWLFTFPPEPDIKVVMTYEEYNPHTKAKELEWHNNDMMGYVISGEFTVELPGKGEFVAKKGDAFYLKAGTEHIVSNSGDRVLKMLVVELNQ